MKHNFLKTFLIISMTVCAFTAIPQNAHALPVSDADIHENSADPEASSKTGLTSSSSGINKETGTADSSNTDALQASSSTNSDVSSSNINTSVSVSNNVSVNNQNLINNQSMSKDEAQQILMNADGDYINKVLSNKKNAALNYDRQVNAMNIKQFYDIIDEPCHVFSLTYDFDDLFKVTDSVYYVGMNSKRVYAINGESAQFYAYEVSSNRKANSFISKISDTCTQWHD